MPSYDDIVAQMKGTQAATGTQPANPYDDAVRSLQDENDQTQSRAALTVSLSADQNPDTAAVNNALAKRYRVGPEVVATYPQEFRDRMALELARSNLEGAPQLQQRIANQPQTAALIHDDIPNAAAVERALTVGDVNPTLLGTVGDLGSQFMRAGGATVSPAFTKVFQAIGAPLAGFDALVGTNTADVPFSAARWFDEYAQRYPTEQRAGFVGKLAQTLGSTAGLIAEALSTGGEAATVGPGASAMQAIGAHVAHGVQAMLTPASIASQDVTQKVLERGGSTADALKAGVTSYLTNTMGGVVPFATPGRLLYRMGTGAVMGPLQAEVSRQAMNAALPADMQSAAPTAEDRSMDAITGMLFGALAGPRNIAHDLVSDTAASHQAEQDFQRMTTLGQLSAASKWRERDPEGFHEFVNAVTEDGQLANVYVDAKVFAQALDKTGMDPQTLQRTMPEIAAQLPEALMTDGSVRIPTADYASAIAGGKLDAELLPHLKTDPAGKSYEEAQAFYQEQAQRMQETAAQLVAGRADQDAFRASQARVQDKLQGDLEQLGRFTPDVNRVYATVQSAILSRLAAHEGITPEEAHAKYAPQLAGGAASGAFDQATARTIEVGGARRHIEDTNGRALGRDFDEQKNFWNWFGDSKATDENGRPLVVYHGTPTDFEAFNAGQGGTTTGAAAGRTGFFFTNRPDIAQRYAERAEGSPQIMPTYLSMKDPVRASFDNMKQADEFLEKGFAGDGAILTVGKQTVYAVKSPEQIKSAIGNDGSYDAHDPNILSQEARGAFNPASNTISLLKDADLSTYLHETGHWALDAYARIAAAADAPEAIRADMARVLKWFGVESLDKWNAMSVDEQRPFHEQFARAFEGYLLEGKAPSQELQPFFQRIRAWMVNIYRSLQALNVPLTSEVRGVFDRMLASDEAIQEAQAARVFQPLFTEKPAGMTADEWSAYKDLGTQATNDAVQAMQEKSLRDMKWLSNAKSKALREVQKQAKAARDAVTREVQEEVANEPVYRLQDFLKGKKLADFDPEQLADLFGFKSGEEALRALAEAPARKEVIEGLTDRYMIERHGELSSPEAIDAAASAAVHNEARARFVATGLKVLTKSPIPARELLRGAKEAAESAIGARRIRDLNVRQHEAAESKSNRDALKLVAKEPHEAALAQRASLLNNQLVKATQAALADVQKGLDYFARLAKDSVREKIDVAFRDQIDQLLGRYDLRRSLTPEQASEKSMVSLEAFVEKLAAMKFAVDVPESMIVDANRMHYKDMAVENFRGLVDAVKSLEHLGREVQKVTDGKESRLLADVAAEAVAQTEKLPKRTAETNRGLSRIEDKWVKLKSFARSVQASLLKMEQMVDWLDDYNPNGVFNRMVFRKIADAEGRRNDLDLKISKAWEDAVAKLPPEVVQRGSVEIPGVVDALTGKNQRLTWGEKIALAGIRGDAQHFSKLLKGERWDPEAVLSFLDRSMSKAEWDFVDTIAGTFQELFPLKQQMLRELGSTSPQEVARIPFQTPHGERAGWYWPITYDPARSHSVKERAARHEASLFEDNIYTRADTSTGREQTRNDNYAKPMLLSIDVLPRVLKDEIRDITTRKSIIEADRFLAHPDVRRAVQGVLSPEHYDQFNGWLLSLANDAAVKPSELQMWDRVAHEIRTRTTMVGLGFRVSTMVMHGATAAGESVAEAGFKSMGKGLFSQKTWAGLMGALGPEWLNRGIESFNRDGQWAANRDFIVDRSSEMRHRMNEIERDVREQLRAIHLRLMDPATGALERGKLAISSRAYQGIAMLDMASAMPTWMGAYLKAMSPSEKGGLALGEQDAVYFADKTVRNAHGGGGVKDMAAVQRGNEFQKLFTMFYTFWNHNINRIMDTAKRVRELPRAYGDAKDTGDWAGFRGDVGNLVLRSFMYTLGVQAVHHMIHPPKDDEGEEGWVAWFGEQMASSAFGGVPIFRDVVGHYAGGKDYEMSPVASVISNTDRMLQDFKDGSTHERWIKHAMTEAGYLLGMPLGQPGSSAQFLSDVWDGKQHPEDIAEWWRGLTSGDMQKH